MSDIKLEVEFDLSGGAPDMRKEKEIAGAKNSEYYRTLDANVKLISEQDNKQYPKVDRYTIFIDLDGVCFKHFSPNLEKQFDIDLPLLPGVKEAWLRWGKLGYIIVVCSGRRRSMEEITKKQLEKHGLSYDYMLLGLTNAKRAIINDKKPSEDVTCIAINLNRDEGLTNLQI
jgi:hypothetical protein